MSRMAPILIIEDEQDSRIMLATLLRRLGYQTLTARDGVDGLARARQTAPSIVLLDLHMPYMDGEGFRAEQRADPALASIPVVIVTADPERARARGLDVDDVLSKPIDVDKLTATIERYVGPAPQPLF